MDILCSASWQDTGYMVCHHHYNASMKGLISDVLSQAYTENYTAPDLHFYNIMVQNQIWLCTHAKWIPIFNMG